MYQFSWTRADSIEHRYNILIGQPFKFLIPIEFGGGYIHDVYNGVGTMIYDGIEYDMYELIAFWNNELLMPPPYRGSTVKDLLEFHGRFTPMKSVDADTTINRSIGAYIGGSDEEFNRLRYPLKIVADDYIGTYEDCGGRSYLDPNNGSSPLMEENMKQYKYIGGVLQ